MIPNGVWATSTEQVEYKEYSSRPLYSSIKIFSLSLGPSNINEGEAGLDVNWWLFERESDGWIKLYKFIDGEPVFVQDLMQQLNVKELSGGFNQNGDPLVFFNSDGTLYLWWFDPVVEGYALTSIGEGSNPKATFDLRYETGNATSDVLLFYVRAGACYYRQQRDRYTIEHPTPAVSGAHKILAVDMTVDYRLQLIYR